MAIYIFGYTKSKNVSDTKIKWFLELVYTPNKEAFSSYFSNLHTIKDRIPPDGQWTDQLKIDTMQFVKDETSKFRLQFVDMLEIIAPDIHKKVDLAVKNLTDILVKVLDNDELKLNNSKTYTREVGSPIVRAKANIINEIFEYKG